MKRITFSMALVDGAGLWWPRIKIKPCSWLRKEWEGLGKHNQPDIAQSFPDLSGQRTQMPYSRSLGLCGHNQPGTCPMSLESGGLTPSYQSPHKVSRPGHMRQEKQQLCPMPCGWGGQVSTKCHLVTQSRTVVLGSWAPLWWECAGWGNGREREADGSWSGERGRSAEVMVVRNRLIWMTC